jgi:hypothetical protein
MSLYLLSVIDVPSKVVPVQIYVRGPAFVPLLEAPMEFTVSESRIAGDNIKMDLQEVECGVWIGSSWLRG